MLNGNRVGKRLNLKKVFLDHPNNESNKILFILLLSFEFDKEISNFIPQLFTL